MNHVVSLHGWFAPSTIKRHIKPGKVREGIPSMFLGDTSRALPDPTRREILNLLERGSTAVGQIMEHLNTTGATISYHLNVLGQMGLIEDRRSGRYIYYELSIIVFQEVLLWLYSSMEEDEKHERK